MTEVVGRIASSTSTLSRSAPSTALSRTTRCLSAAAYTDWRFRLRVLALWVDPLRAKAPELGIDVSTVVHHCRVARARAMSRAALLLVPAALLVFSGVFADAVAYPAELPVVIDFYMPWILAAWIAAALIVFAFDVLTRHITLVRQLSAKSVAAPFPSTSGNTGNVIIYGAFSPFIGSGIDVGGYSFTVNLEQHAAGVLPGEQQPFETDELYDHLKTSFERLAIDNLVVEENIFVDGQELRDDARFLPDPLRPPRIHVSAEGVGEIKAKPSKCVRFYLTVRIVDWSGEVVLSMFVRVVKNSSKLFVENSIFLLPPLKKKYYEVDSLSLHSPVRQTLQSVFLAVLTSPFLLAFSPFMLLWNAGSLWEHYQRRQQQRKEIRENPRYNYGALQSVREIGMENTWRVYFQKLDNQMNSKIVQQQLIDCIVGFLDERGYDTADIKDRGNHILNNGVMISGGSIQAESLAVGEGAQVKRKTAGAAKA